MILAYLLLTTGLTISAVAIYYSVVGLTAIFSAAAIPIMIMGVSLEVAKLVCATWIKQNWTRVPRLMKAYMCIAITVLMLITSMGIFGFLSKAHNDQNLVSGDVQSKIAIYDEKIKTARENIEADRKQLRQMDDAVDQVMARSTSEGGADKSNAIRKSQQRDRSSLAKDIEINQKAIAQLNDEAAPIRAEIRKVDAEVGPIKYIAAFIYGTAPDASMLEKAVTWIIILIVIVFDPLAVIMLLASQMTFAWARGETPKEKDEDSKLTDWFARAKARAKFWDQQPKYEQDDGSLTDEQIAKINRMLSEEGYVIEPEAPVVSSMIDEPEDSDLDKWNKMIEEAERQVSEETSTVEERVAAGETYIDGTGKEVEFKEEPVLITRIAYPESNVNLSGLEADLPAKEDTPTYMINDAAGTAQVLNRDVGYVQNGEQSSNSIWGKVVGINPIDQLYKDYSDHKFEDFQVDETTEPELAAFVAETKLHGPRFSDYPVEKIAYFEERIHELRKNNSNNTTR